jgi:hypothetical protein
MNFAKTTGTFSSQEKMTILIFCAKDTDWEALRQRDLLQKSGTPDRQSFAPRKTGTETR